VDYILFMTGNVDVTANANEIRDWKYVDKAELQAMFKNQGEADFIPVICERSRLTRVSTQETYSRPGLNSSLGISYLVGGMSC
jgi:isopentenyldiphosphate isomerase